MFPSEKNEDSVPAISVIMSVYNGERFVAEAVESILTQTFSDFEFIIVDDGSNDSTQLILSRFTDRRVRLLRNQRNVGLATALNIGLQSAQGKYIARHDADDVSLADRFSLQVAYLESHPEISIVGTTVEIIDERNVGGPCMRVPHSNVDIKWALLFGCPIIHGTVMGREAAFRGAHGYTEDPSFGCVEDLELWSRMSERHNFVNLQEQLGRRRSHLGAISHQKRELQQEQGRRVLRRSIGSVLGVESLEPVVFEAIEKFLLSGPNQRVEVSGGEIRSAITVLRDLREKFYRKHGFPESTARSHRRRTSAQWAKHLAALTFKAKYTADLRSRFMFLDSGLKLLATLPSASS
jgi:hypothetical protein